MQRPAIDEFTHSVNDESSTQEKALYTAIWALRDARVQINGAIARIEQILAKKDR